MVGSISIQDSAYLDEADVLSVFSEALTADVEVVFANDTPLVATYSAARQVETRHNHRTNYLLPIDVNGTFAARLSASSELL